MCISFSWKIEKKSDWANYARFGTKKWYLQQLHVFKIGLVSMYSISSRQQNLHRCWNVHRHRNPLPAPLLPSRSRVTCTVCATWVVPFWSDDHVFRFEAWMLLASAARSWSSSCMVFFFFFWGHSRGINSIRGHTRTSVPLGTKRVTCRSCAWRIVMHSWRWHGHNNFLSHYYIVSEHLFSRRLIHKFFHDGFSAFLL